MPEYIVRQVKECRIEATNINLANYVGHAVLEGEPPVEELAGDNKWDILEKTTVKAFMVEEDE